MQSKEQNMKEYTTILIQDGNIDLHPILDKADKDGAVILTHNNKRFLLTPLIEEGEPIILTKEEKIEIVAKRLLTKYQEAFEVLGND